MSAETVMNYKRKLNRRKWFFRILIFIIVVYCFVLVALGAGDSRKVNPFVISFGSTTILLMLIYLVAKSNKYARLLQQNDYNVLQNKMNYENNKNSVWLYEKTGGNVYTCSFIGTALITITCSFFSNEAFLSSLIILIFLFIIKCVFLLYYRRKKS